MASKYEPTLLELAMEPDDDRRLEMAAEIDRDAAELDERWENRDAYASVEAERDEIAAQRDAAAAERDEWRKRYADRFFDPGEGETYRQEIVDKNVEDVKKESTERGYAALWNDR